jgi:hypothetical protein
VTPGYALVEKLPVEVRHPIGFGWARAETTARWLVDLPATEGDVTWTAKLCDLSTEPTFGAVTTYPSAFVDATPLRVRTARFVDGTFHSGPFVEKIGGDDDDHDGHPGVTVSIAHPFVGKGEVWIRQEAELSYVGVLDDAEIRGLVTWEPRQKLLGASTWWLRIPVRQRGRDAGTFTMTSIADATCEAVRQVAE